MPCYGYVTGKCKCNNSHARTIAHVLRNSKHHEKKLKEIAVLLWKTTYSWMSFMIPQENILITSFDWLWWRRVSNKRTLSITKIWKRYELIAIQECAYICSVYTDCVKIKSQTVLFDIAIFKTNLSRDMTKPTKWSCTQRRLRSAWASAQPDLSLRCPHEETLDP